MTTEISVMYGSEKVKPAYCKCVVHVLYKAMNETKLKIEEISHR